MALLWRSFVLACLPYYVWQYVPKIASQCLEFVYVFDTIQFYDITKRASPQNLMVFSAWNDCCEKCYLRFIDTCSRSWTCNERWNFAAIDVNNEWFVLTMILTCWVKSRRLTKECGLNTIVILFHKPVADMKWNCSKWRVTFRYIVLYYCTQLITMLLICDYIKNGLCDAHWLKNYFINFWINFDDFILFISTLNCSLVFRFGNKLL